MASRRPAMSVVPSSGAEPLIVIQGGKQVGVIDDTGRFVPTPQPKQTPLGRHIEELSEAFSEALPSLIRAGDDVHKRLEERYRGQPAGGLRLFIADFFVDTKINHAITESVGTYVKSVADQVAAYAADQAAFFDIQRELALDELRGELEWRRAERHRQIRQADLIVDFEHGPARQTHEFDMAKQGALHAFKLKLEALRVAAEAQADQNERDHEQTLEVLRLAHLLPDALAEVETLPAEKASELMAAFEVVSTDFDALIQESSAQLRRQKAAALLPMLALLLKSIAVETTRTSKKRPARARTRRDAEPPVEAELVE